MDLLETCALSCALFVLLFPTRRNRGSGSETSVNGSAPTALRFSPAGDRLYVVDAHNRRVQAFAPDGSFLFAFGADGGEGPALDLPHGVAVGADGSLTGYRWGIERKRALLEREQERERTSRP